MYDTIQLFIKPAREGERESNVDIAHSHSTTQKNNLAFKRPAFIYIH